MIRRTLAAVAAVTLTSLAIPPAPSVAAPKASAAKPSSRSCFWTGDVRNYVTDGDDVLNILVGVRDVWRLDLLGPCNDIDWPNQIALRARGGGGMICSALDAEILYRAAPMPPQRCLVRSLRKLTPQEVAALPKKARP